MLTCKSVRSYWHSFEGNFTRDCNWEEKFCYRYLSHQSLNLAWKLPSLKLYKNLPGANQLIGQQHILCSKYFLAATKQLYKWYFPSVCPSVRLSVCLSVRHTFLTMFPSSYHHEIFRSYYQWQKWRPCKRSRSEVKGQGHRGHNPTLPFPDCNSSLNSCMVMKWCI